MKKGVQKELPGDMMEEAGAPVGHAMPFPPKKTMEKKAAKKAPPKKAGKCKECGKKC